MTMPLVTASVVWGLGSIRASASPHALSVSDATRMASSTEQERAAVELQPIEGDPDTEDQPDRDQPESQRRADPPAEQHPGRSRRCGPALEHPELARFGEAVRQEREGRHRDTEGRQARSQVLDEADSGALVDDLVAHEGGQQDEEEQRKPDGRG